MQPVVIIPARYNSTRFPGKPLIDIMGRTMISRTWERCTKAIAEKNIYVATDDDRVLSHCRAQGIQALMTSVTCQTGTDRLWEAANQIPADLYIDVQGDEPVIDPSDILTVATEAKRRSGAVVNGMCEIDNEREFRSPMVPKVVTAPDGRLLYMSRAPIPSNKSDQFKSAKRQVCIMAYTKDSLDAFVSVPTKTPMEKIEDLEMLRFLELGIPVQMVDCSNTSIPVDVPDDLARVEARLREMGE